MEAGPHGSDGKNRVLVTGATGYIGSRLIPRLLEAGYTVRAMGREMGRLQGRPWSRQVELVEGDVLKPETLPTALAGVHTAYYLIHSLAGGDDFHQRDLEAARHFGETARRAGVQRLIYLGGLGDPTADLSRHLRSRQETGEALRASGLPVTEFRAAIIVGSGSISFEMIRNLTERLPVMIAPRWVYTRIQPIAVRDVLAYLVAALTTPASTGQMVEIGGADVLTYAEMMRQYAEERGLRRLIIPVPVLTPRLSAYWVHWMTPISAAVARPLIEGLRNEVVVRDDRARRLFPQIQPMTYREAIRRALARLQAGDIESRWSDALASSRATPPPVLLTMQEGMIVERRQLDVDLPPALLFRRITGLGGERGWAYWNWAWRLRGALDRLVGGVGLRRGRRDPQAVRVGDTVDFWRVEVLEPDRRLRLRAEMRLPGQAWLQFDLEPLGPGRTRLVQTAFFAPKGLPGLLYWYGLYPAHAFIFSGLIQSLAQPATPAEEVSRQG
ncbi:MAG: NAD-dependent epimerase [Litorilinea sp.]|nr:MAG: NAD-dependent epimerase [Litorilinea sp.]